MATASQVRLTSGVSLHLQRSRAVRVGVVGRVAELAVIERFVAAIRAGAGTLVLEGDAGIGKTALVEAAGRLAQVRGLRVLACVGGSARAWAALAELLAGIEPQQLETLPGPQR